MPGDGAAPRNGFELFGYVSYAPAARTTSRRTSTRPPTSPAETAEANPDWRIDLCDEVIGTWRGEQGKRGGDDARLGRARWSTRGAIATAELADLAVDQCLLVEGRFTLLAPDDYRGDTLDVQALRRAAATSSRASRCTRGRRGRLSASSSELRSATRRTHKAFGAEPRRPRDAAASCSTSRAGRPTTTSRTRGASACSAPARWRASRRRPARRRAGKLDRAPTLVAGRRGAVRDDPVRPTRRTCSPPAAPPTSSCSAPTAAGWPATGARPPCCARRRAAPRSASPTTSTLIGLLHLGPPRQEQRVPERAPAGDVVSWLD